MPPDSDAYPPLSALNDLLFCERRCFMHRVEEVWVENLHTAAASRDHRRVHEPHDADLAAGRTARGLWVVSHRLRLVGVCDVVEFRSEGPADGASKKRGACRAVSPKLPNRVSEKIDYGPEGGQAHFAPWTSQNEPGPAAPFPIEYKRGKRRRWDNNEVQLCAQAMAIEEMLGVAVPAGAIYFVKTRRRQEVVFDQRLRAKTEAAAKRLHEVLRLSTAPPPIRHPKCKQCSLYALCLPELVGNAAAYERVAARLFQADD